MKTRIPLVAAFLVVGVLHLHAATLPVTSTGDSGPGTLRAALASAANGDTINFSVAMPATITLTSGELLVTNNLTIIGPGQSNLAVDGNAATSVFHIAPSNIVTIASLTITNGNAASSGRGGGIWNDHATLTVSNCTLSGNSSGTYGGGIANDGDYGGSANLQIVNSTVSGNSAPLGGGINNLGALGSANAEIVNCTISGNLANGGGGGGIDNDGCCGGSAILEIANSTVSDNFAFDGGGIANGGADGSANAEIVNCTISGNSAPGGGGGIDNNDFGIGSASLQIGSTVLNANGFGGNITNESGTVTSLGYNLSSDDGGGLFTDTTDQINTDPMLGPLQYNGGPTFTHALLSGSPATDQGRNFSASATDQRGAGFVRTVDDPSVPNATGGDGTDIGAFELGPVESWIAGNGKWETTSNWSLGVAPSLTESAILITNAGKNTITIDAATSGSFSNSLTINSLIVGAPPGSTNTLFLNNAGLAAPLHILNGFTITANGALFVTNSDLRVDGIGLSDSEFTINGSVTVSNGTVLATGVEVGGTLTIAGGTNTFLSFLDTDYHANLTGAVWVTGGLLTVANDYIDIGNGFGQMTVSNGTVLGSSMYLGFNPGSLGTLTVAGGLTSLSSFLEVASSPNATGFVWMTGGQLTVTNDEIYLGVSGVGQMTVSNGTWSSQDIYVGYDLGSQGTLTIAGGTHSLSSALEVGYHADATGAVWVTGGQLDITNGIIDVGFDGVGQMTVSNGTVLIRNGYVAVAADPGSLGTLTVAGGLLDVTDGFIDLGFDGVGQMTVSNGTLLARNGQVDVGGNNGEGTLTVAGGLLDVTDGFMEVGFDGVGQMTVFNGTALADYMAVGADIAEGTLTVAGGSLVVTNAGDTGEIDVLLGMMAINGGTVTVDILTGIAAFSFDSGTLNTKSTTMNNGSVVAVGDGASVATLHLIGGVHSFIDGLQLRNNAFLTGCGTISGDVLADAGASVLADCGTTLNFSGTVTNNGTVTASNGTVLNFYGPVVNNGLIDASGGNVRFFSTLNDNGSVLTPPTNSWIAGNAKWETAANWSRGRAPSINDMADVIANPGNNTVTIDAITSGSFPNTLTISNLVVAAPLNSTNTLLLSDAGTNAPLVVLNSVSVNDGGSVILINSALQVNGPAGGAVTVDGQLTMDSGTILVSSNLLVGSSNPLSLVTVWGGALYVTNAAHTAVTEVRNGTLVLTGGVYFTDSLLITNTGASFINDGGTFTITGLGQVDQGTQTVASGTTQLSSNLVVGGSVNSTGAVDVTGGQLVVTNGTIGIGNDGTVTNGNGVGLMTVSNGTVVANTILLGSSAGGRGDLILADGGIISCPAGTDCLISINSLGFDQIGGDLVWPNGSLECGVTAAGDYNVLSGTAAIQDLYVGYSDMGTMTMAGGVVTVSSHLIVGHLGPPFATAVSTGIVWITGGQLTIANYSIIGNSGVGQMTISNGTVTAASVIVANSGNPGTLSLQGGTLTANLVIKPNGRFLFSRGRLQADATTNVNGQTFVIGDGVDSAAMKLTGGIHSFDTGLTVSPNAYLTGCGTINGTVVNLGTITSDCAGGTLSFNGVFTNNATIVVANGSIVDFNGPVVNSGTINTLQGTVHFNSTVTNIGGLLTAPVAGFTANRTRGAVPLAVTFSDASTGAITNRAWNFGDGGSSAVANVIHTYIASGSYPVSLSVFGLGGASTLTSNNLITVTNVMPTIVSSPVASNTLGTVGGVTLVEPDQTIGFSVGSYDANGNVLSCAWDFGDGSTSADCSPSHVFTNCGPHDVAVTISEGVASVTTGMTVAVTCPMDVSSLKMQVKFKRVGADSCIIKGTLAELPGDFPVARAFVTLDVGEAQAGFQLNAKRRAVNRHGNIKFTYNKKASVWTFNGKLKGDYRAAWNKYGLVNDNMISDLITVPVLLVFQSSTLETFEQETSLSYNAKLGKLGTAKLIRK